MRVCFYVSIDRIVGAPQSGPRPLAAAHSWKGPYDHDRNQSHRGVGGVRSVNLASVCRHEGTNDEQHAQVRANYVGTAARRCSACPSLKASRARLARATGRAPALQAADILRETRLYSPLAVLAVING